MSGALDRIRVRTAAVLADEVHRDVELGSVNFLYCTPVQLLLLDHSYSA